MRGGLGQHGVRLATIGLALCAALPSASGCGEQFGAFVYFFGLYPKQKIPAEFTLTKGRLAVLIDDDADLISQPDVKKKLTDDIAKHFRENDVVTTVIPFEQVKALQQHDRDFDTMAADRVGKVLDADQVLWIKVGQFDTGSTQAADTNKAAAFAVALRVLTTKATNRDEVQLWPEMREPRNVTVNLPLSVVQRKNDPRVIAEMLAEELAKDIAELFYQHPMEEPT
jgi:hypothetical protein